MAKFRVMATREEWVTVTIEADNKEKAEQIVCEMSYEQLMAVNEQYGGDFQIIDVKEVSA